MILIGYEATLCMANATDCELLETVPWLQYLLALPADQQVPMVPVGRSLPVDNDNENSYSDILMHSSLKQQV